MKCNNSPKSPLKKKRLDGKIRARQMEANFCRTSAVEPVPDPMEGDVFTLVWRGRRLFLQRERASRLNYSSADWSCTHFTSAGTCRETRLAEKQRGGGAEEEDEGCHKHGNQSDRRRQVGIKEQQEKRRPGISSLIFLLSRTSQSSLL